MKTLTLILGCLILAALITPLLHAAAKAVRTPPHSTLRTLQRALGLHAGILQVNALTDGIHPDGKLGHLKADAAHTARHLVVKRGSDADHFALGAAADQPLGICTDQPPAAEIIGAVALFGVTPGTLLAVGSEEIAVGAEVYGGANGKLQDQPAGAGAYWKVGRAVTACAADGGQFEISHHRPVRVVILANSADLNALKAAATAPSEIMYLGA